MRRAIEHSGFEKRFCIYFTSLSMTNPYSDSTSFPRFKLTGEPPRCRQGGIEARFRDATLALCDARAR